MGGVMEGMERRGRPRVERDPNERVPMSTRIRGDLFNRLSDAARQNNRTLGNEVEHRLAGSFEPVFPEEARKLALRLWAIYTHGGASALVRDLLHIDDPDQDEFNRRWHGMFSVLQREHPFAQKSGFITDEEAFLAGRPQPEEKQ
jgi:hypothetical protein